MKPLLFLVCCFIFFLLTTSSSCNKTELGPSVLNNSLIILVKKNSQRLPDSVLDYMKLSYYKNGSKQYVPDFIRGQNEGPYLGRDEGVQGTRQIGKISGDDGIKTYYLEYPNSTQDTLFVDYRHLDFDQAVKEPCYCYWPLREVRYNGQIAIIDTSIKGSTVYLFNKR